MDGQSRIPGRIALCAACGGDRALDQVDFKLPIRQGQMVETIARVVSVGRSSIKVEVELIAEDLLSGVRELCTRGHFVMIALGDDGKPTSVPALPMTDKG